MTRLGNWSLVGSAWAANLGMYLLFTDNVGFRELLAATITAGLATVATIVFATAGNVRFTFRAADIAQGWRVPGEILAETVKILRGLILQLFTGRRISSSFSFVRFNAGVSRDPLDAGRRALAITYNTATPNTVVLGIVESQNIMIFHQLMMGPASPMLGTRGAMP